MEFSKYEHSNCGALLIPQTCIPVSLQVEHFREYQRCSVTYMSMLVRGTDNILAVYIIPNNIKYVKISSNINS